MLFHFLLYLLCLFSNPPFFFFFIPDIFLLAAIWAKPTIPGIGWGHYIVNVISPGFIALFMQEYCIFLDTRALPVHLQDCIMFIFIPFAIRIHIDILFILFIIFFSYFIAFISFLLFARVDFVTHNSTWAIKLNTCTMTKQ